MFRACWLFFAIAVTKLSWGEIHSGNYEWINGVGDFR